MLPKSYSHHSIHTLLDGGDILAPHAVSIDLLAPYLSSHHKVKVCMGNYTDEPMMKSVAFTNWH